MQSRLLFRKHLRSTAAIDILAATVNLQSPSPRIGPVKTLVRKFRLSERAGAKAEKPGTARLFDQFYSDNLFGSAYFASLAI
jgi:hypothetical protein